MGLPIFVDGEFVPSAGALLPVTDPATQRVLAEVPFATDDEIDRAVASATTAFETWREVARPGAGRD